MDADRSTEGRSDRGRDAQRPGDIPAKGWKDVLVRVKDEVQNDHMVLVAAGVAFFGFLAMIPALAALASIAGLVTSPSAVASRAETLFGGLPAEAEELLTSQLESLAGQSGGALTLGLAVSLFLSLWSASAGMQNLVEGVNIAYDEIDDRNFFVKKGLALLLTLGAIIFVVFAAVGLAALPDILSGLGLPGWLQTVLQFAFWPLLAIAFMAGLSVIYRVGPDRDDPEWRWVSWGAVIAVVLWMVVSVLFRIYTANFGSYNETYGSLAAVVVLMLWLFITSFIVLLGAQINSELEHQTAHDTTQGPDEPMGRRDAAVADTLGRSADSNDGDRNGDRDGDRDGDRNGDRDGDRRTPAEWDAPAGERRR